MTLALEASRSSSRSRRATRAIQRVEICSVIFCVPEEIVPAGRFDAGAVTAGEGEAAVGPGNPGGNDFLFREIFEEGGVLLRGWKCGEGRAVPCATDHGDFLKAFLLRGANGFAHESFAAEFAFGVEAGGGGLDARFAQCGHRFENGGKDFSGIAAMLDHVFPPAFGIGIAGGARERSERIGDEWRFERRDGRRFG